MKTTWTTELGACVRLAAPIALAQLAQMAMALSDTAIVTPLGAQQLGAVGLGNNAFFGVVWPLVGILLCLDTEASQAVGRDDKRGAAKSFLQAMWLWLGIVVVASAAVFVVSANMNEFGVNPEVAPSAGMYLRAMIPGIPPVAFTFASTKFLQAHGKTRPVVLIALAANLINIFLVLGLVRGRFGFPQLGIVGAGHGTAICRWLIALTHLAVLLRGGFPFHREDIRPDRKHLKEMLALGVPAGLQFALEIGIFALAGFMIARFEPSMLAAHHILLQLASATFMIPVGISAAAAVRVGNAIGAGLRTEAAHRGYVAIALSAVWMAVSSCALLLFGSAYSSLFNAPPAVTEVFVSLVVYAAAFQIFDGIQVTTTGALRGLGDTRSAFVVNLLGHWFIALPLALLFGFRMQMQARGIWLALAVGLTVVAIALLWVWRSHAVRLRAWIAPSSSAEITSSSSSITTS